MKYRMISVVLLVVLSIAAIGQEFRYKAAVDEVNEDGFYKILLSPEVTAQLNNDFFDIRLYNEDAEVPYILNKEQAVTEQEFFVEYEIVDIKHFKKQRYTRIVIHNPKKNVIDNIVLRVKNADVKKNLKLNASNNQRDWYVLKDHYDYNSIAHRKGQSEIRVLNFPSSNYEFYEILIDDYRDQPIYVEKAGYYDSVKEGGQYSALKNISFTQKDTLKETIIAIPIAGNYIDKIIVDITAPKYYRRQASLYVNRIWQGKRVAISHAVTQKRFELMSNSSNTLYLNDFTEDTLFIRIANNDNVPLQIQGIHLFQLNKYITAELLAGKSYEVKYGDERAVKPNYDLKYFSESIPSDIKTININAVQQLFKPSVNDKNGNMNVKNYWLWISVVVVGIFLFYMSYKMVNDNKKE